MNRGGETIQSTNFSELKNSSELELAGALQSTLRDVQSRDYTLDIQQETALQMLGGALLDGQKSGYIEMATGTGKTTIEALVTEAAIKSGKRVLILASKISIARQISGQGQAQPTGLTIFTNLHSTTSVGHHFGSQRASENDQVVISTYPGFLNDSKREHQLGEFDVVIADECHRSLGQKTAKALKDSFPEAIKLGFSATPDYATDRKSDEVFDNKLFEFSLIDAIESGKTAPLRTLIYETDQALALNENRADFTERELAPLINNIERNGTAYQLAVDFLKDGRQGIIACVPGASNIHARMMADMLCREEACVAADVGAHLSDEENAFRLKAFQEGDIQVLTFTRALEEGWDSDRASFCINMVPTASPVRTKQLMGRILRKNPDGRESIYVDFLDEKEGFTKQQYTALHALDLDTIDINRVLGVSTGEGPWRVPEPQGLPVISDRLYQRIIRSNGKLIDELNTTQSKKIDPLVLHWERVLTKEGMSAELPENEVLSQRFEKAYEQSRRRLERELGEEPFQEEIIAELREILPQDLVRAMGFYGTKLSLEEYSSELPEYPDESPDPFEIIAQGSLRWDIYDALDQLAEKESGIVSLSVGLIDDDPQTLSEVGSVYGLSRERIRQIQSKAMSKLRHPRLSKNLRIYLEDGRQSKEIEAAETMVYKTESQLNKDQLDELDGKHSGVISALYDTIHNHRKNHISATEILIEYSRASFKSEIHKNKLDFMTTLTYLKYGRARLFLNHQRNWENTRDVRIMLSIFDEEIERWEKIMKNTLAIIKKQKR